MTNNLPPGSEPATYGGSGWTPRGASHASEIGVLWRSCGSRSEYARLEDVMLAWPPDSIASAVPPDRWLFLDTVDLDALRRQTEAVAAFYESRGVRVHMLRPPPDASPNVLFLRDVFFATPEGAMLARMASRQRAGEERLAAQTLAAIGVPILRTPRGEATFEGADALWLDERTVAVGIGLRTNGKGFAELSSLLAEMGVKTVPVELPAGVQHLLGIVNPIAPDLAAVDAERAPASLQELLAAHGYRVLELGPPPEVRQRRALNFVTLAPRELVMPAGCPGARRQLEEAGVTCHEVDVSEYVKAAGALGCLTGIVRRSC